MNSSAGVRVATVSPGFPLENVVATVIGSKDRTQMAITLRGE